MSDLAGAHQLALKLRAASTERPSELVAGWPLVLKALRDKAMDSRSTSLASVLERMRSAGEAVTRSPEIQPWLQDAAPAPAFIALAEAVTTARAADAAQTPHLLASLSWITGGHIVERLRDDIADFWTRPGLDWDMRVTLASGAGLAKPRIDAATILGNRSRAAGEGNKPSELDIAVGEWDIFAHRALAEEPSSLAIALVAHRQLQATNALRAQLGQGRDRGLLTNEEYQRVVAGLDRTVSSWDGLLDTVRPMASGTHNIPRAFWDVGHRLEEALRNFPIERVDGSSWRALLTSQFSTNVALAAAVRDAITDERVVGIARTIAEQIRQHPEWAGRGLAADIDPRAVQRRETVKLPPAYRAALLDGTLDLVGHSVDALHSSAGLDQGVTRRQADSPTATANGRPPEHLPMSTQPPPAQGPAI